MEERCGVAGEGMPVTAVVQGDVQRPQVVAKGLQALYMGCNSSACAVGAGDVEKQGARCCC